MSQPSGFSETTYAFCFIREVLDTWGHGTFPVMPSTYQEGQTGGGYDAAVNLLFGGVAFVQFKVPVTMDHHRSGESDDLGLPYFRFKVPKRRTTQPSSQHEMLVDLELNPDAVVIYASPRFGSAESLQAAFTAGTLYQNSFCPYPSGLGPMDPEEEHAVNYRLVDSKCVVRSEPLTLDSVKGPGLITPNGFTGREQRRRMAAVDAEELAQQIETRVADSERGFVADMVGDRSGFERLRLMSRLVLSAEALPLPQPAEEGHERQLET